MMMKKKYHIINNYLHKLIILKIVQKIIMKNKI